MRTEKTLNIADIKDGIFELQSVGSSCFLDALDSAVYNGVYDDALTLSDKPSRRAKVPRIPRSSCQALIFCSGRYHGSERAT